MLCPTYKHLHYWQGEILQFNLTLGDMAQEELTSGGRLPVRSHPGRVEVSLSKTPNP